MFGTCCALRDSGTVVTVVATAVATALVTFFVIGVGKCVEVSFAMLAIARC